jgi:large subunit ribosomal protein L11
MYNFYLQLMLCSRSFFNQDFFIENILYLKIKSHNATTGPPIGPILSQCGLTAASFCKDFNERTSIFKDNILLFVSIYVYSDNTYDFDLAFPSDAYFFKKACLIKRGMAKPG